MSKTIRPIGNCVLVKEIKHTQTDGGIFLPDAVQEVVSKGKVIAVGSGRHLESGERFPIEVEDGDVVIFSNHGVVPFVNGGEQLIAIREDHIYCVEE